MTALLTLTDVVTGYARAVSPATSLSVARGEVVGLAGANGIGKSTVLKAILGLARVFAGRLECAPHARIGYLAQQPVRLPELPLSGREMLRCLGADALQPPARLAARLATRVDRLSGGEYQLLCLWVCLAGAVDLVLLDEPTNNLDGDHVQVAIAEIVAARAQRAALVVSHDRLFLEAVSTRIVFLKPSDG